MHLFFVFIALLSLSSAQTYKGYYQWTWRGNNAPAGTNIGIAFNGWITPTSAVGDSNNVKSGLPSTKYLALGGGNSNGRWTASQLTAVNNAINAGTFSGYAGLCYDIEEGDTGLASSFEKSFQTAKSKGFKVLVTISHSGPYGISDASTVMNQIFASTYVDFVSPQLYTTGTETGNDYQTSGGTSWAAWKNSKAPILLSITQSSLWSSANSYFTTTLGFPATKIQGYIVWNNDNPIGTGGTGGTPLTQRCGIDWTNANGKCGAGCPRGQDSDCPAGQHCYASLAAISGCNAAVAETSATTLSDMGMSPAIIGLSVAIVVIGLALIIVSVLLYKKSVVREEERA
jgi:hypothetical protein